MHGIHKCYSRFFGINLISDAKTAKYITGSFKYYTFYSEYEEVDTSKKYDTAPEDGWVAADGSSITIKKAGTYVLYVQPYLFYGSEGEDFELVPVFIVVK